VQEFFKLFLFKSNLILRGKYIIFLFENKQKLNKLKKNQIFRQDIPVP